MDEAQLMALEKRPCGGGPTSADNAVAAQLNRQLKKMRGHMNGYRVSCARCVVQTVKARRLPSKAAVIAIATVIVESTLDNVAGGDRDSVGLYQQRAGWGSVAERMNCATATTKFLDEMLRMFPNNRWTRMSVGEVCWRVQRPAEEYRGRYAVEAGDAALIVGALWGGSPVRGLVCAVSGWLFAQRGPSLWVYRPTKLPVGGPFAGKAREVSKGWGAISRIFSGGNGVLYAIDTAGKLRWYRWNGTTFAKGAGAVIGSGWGGFSHVFSGGDGVVYAVTKDGKLLWYRNDSPLGGVRKWVKGSGKTISTGWGGFTHLFPGGRGVIYAVNKAGELRWYRNANPLTGVGWVKGSGKKIGTGWNTLTCTSAGGGVIYAINKAGELRWYRNINPLTGTGWIKGSGKKIGAGWTGMTPTADLTTCRYV